MGGAECCQAFWPLSGKADLSGSTILTTFGRYEVSASRDNDEAEVELRPTEVKQLLVAAEPILKQEKHSSFSRLVRVMAWVPGFLPNLKRSDGTIKTSLTAREINKAEKVLIRRTQRGAFGEELAALRAKKPWVAS